MDLAELARLRDARPTCLGKPATKVGTEGANDLNGGPGADVIVGLGGNDRINGKGGKDAICAGAGNDKLTGGPAVDEFDGGDGNDVIYSRDGAKERVVRGGPGTDRARRDKADKTTSVERSVSRRRPAAATRPWPSCPCRGAGRRSGGGARPQSTRPGGARRRR